jgi:hypothetical protein
MFAAASSTGSLVITNITSQASLTPMIRPIEAPPTTT